MNPKFDTITGNANGLQVLDSAYSVYKSLPTIINENINEGLANEEIESEALLNSLKYNKYIAADDLGGDSRFLSELELDKDLLGNSMLRTNLGYLSSSDSMDIEDFAENTSGSTKNNFLKIMRGKTDEVLKQLKDKQDKDNNFTVKSYFTPTVDPETGEYILKQVIGTKEDMAKVELAGSSIINSFGPKKLTSNSLLSFTKGFATGIHSLLPGIYSLAAGSGDIAEATKNLITSGEFKSEYGDLNALADYRQEELKYDVPYATTSSKADKDMFDNVESFSNTIGNALSSLVGYGIVGKSLRPLGALSGSLAKTGVQAESLGTIGSAINNAIKKSPELLPMISAGMVLNYGEAYQAARDAGLPLEDAASVGFITGAMNTLIEQKLGSNALTQWLATGKSGKLAAQAIVKETGGDMNKLFNREISNKIVNNIMNTVDKLTSKNGIGLGSALEEGTEEFLQSQMKNSIEVLYDSFIAPDNVEIGKGKFGTELISKDSFKSSLEEAAAGAIVGMLGGFVSSRSKENSSIIPFIVSGEYDALNAGLNTALQKGAISQAQYEGISSRIENLTRLKEENNDLFIKAASYDPENQIKVSEAILNSLDNQDNYINTTDNGSNDNYDSFIKILNESNNIKSNNIPTGISTVERFENKLRDSGRTEEANILRNSIRDAKLKVNNSLPKPKKFASSEEETAWLQSRRQLENQIYTLDVNKLVNKLRNKKLLGELNSLLASDNELRVASNSEFKGNETFINKINELYDNIRNASDLEAVKSEVNKARSYIKDKHIEFLINNPDLQNAEEFAKKSFSVYNNIINDIAYDKELNNVTSEDYVKTIKDTALNIQNLYKQALEAEENAKKERQKVEKLDNYFSSDEYKNYIDNLITSQSIPEDRVSIYGSAKNGDIQSQLDVVNDQIKDTARKLNTTPKANSDTRDLLKSQLDELKYMKDYLQNKKKLYDEEVAKSIFNPVTVDFSNYKDTVTDKDGNKFKILPEGTKRSLKYGMSYDLSSNGETLTVNKDELENYTITDNDGNEMSLKELSNIQSDILDTPKSKVVLNEGQDTNYEPVEHKSKQITDYSKNPEYSGVRLASDKKFEEIINNPKTDVSKFSANVTISENIDKLSGYKEEKAAKKLFNKLKESSDPISELENLSEKELDNLIKYLPLQINIVNKGYTNVLYSFPNENKEKLSVIRALLKGLKVTVKPGDIVRTPGYNNYTKQNKSLKEGLGLKLNKNGVYVLPDGSPLSIGIADSTGSVFYFDTTEDSEYLLTANVTGTPGTPYLIIPASYQLTGKAGYTAKLNPKKIPLDLAQKIADIFADIYLKKIKLNGFVSLDNPYGITPESENRLTYGEFLNNIIFFGESTVGNKREPSKTLFIDYKNNGVIKYGAEQKVLIANDEKSRNDFAKWISENKNFSLSRKNINENSTIVHGFTFKNENKISFNTGKSYLSALIDNDFINTDLNIKEGIIGKSYLIVRNFTIEESKPNTDNSPVNEKPEVTILQKETISFNKDYDNNSLEKIKALPNGSSIRLSKYGSAEYSKKAALFVKDGKLVNSAGKEVITLSDYSDDVKFNKDLRNNLIKEFNIVIDDAIAYEEEHPETKSKDSEGAYSKVKGLKIFTKLVSSKPESEWAEDPEAYKKIEKIILEPTKEIKKQAGSANKQKQVSKSVDLGTKESDFIVDTNNPFVNEPINEETIRLSENYDKLIKYLSGASSKLNYTSYVNNLLGKRPAIPEIGLSKKDVEELIDYELIDGNTVGRILINMGKALPTAKEIETPTEIETEPVKETKEVNVSPIPTIDSINEKTSPFKLQNWVKDPIAYETMIRTWDDNIEEWGAEEINNFVKDFNDLLSESISSEWEIYNRVGRLKLRKKSIQEPKKLDEIPVVQPGTPEYYNKLAGITDEQIGAGKKKSKNKFSKFGNKPSVPMVVSDNQTISKDARKELAVYRKMLGEKAGGNVKFVDELIKIIGQTGRPAWAWSVMNEDGVTLFEKPAEGALYHEAFHRVSLLLLTPEENSRLYKLARKEYSLYNRNDFEVEEFLADRFREYVLNDTPKVRGIVGRVLSNIWNFIRTFLGLNKTKIDNINGLFNAIKKGRYQYAKVNKDALDNFNLRYSNGYTPLTINGVTLHEIYNSALLSNVVSSLTSMTIDINGITDINSLEKGLSFKDVKDNLIDIRDKFLAASQNDSISDLDRAVFTNKVNMYNEIIDNFETVFIPLIDTKLQGYNIRRVENQLDGKDELSNLVNDEIRSSYEFSAKENTQADIRVMFLTLRESSELDPDTFLPKYHNPDTAWYNTFSAVHKAKSIDEMLSILKQKSDETDTIRQAQGKSDKTNMYSELYDTLTATDDEGNQDEMLKTRFWNTFKKHRNRFINAYYNKDTNDKGKKLNSYDITFGDADVNKRSNKLESNWSALFGINGTFSNKKVLKNAVKEYKSLVDFSKKHEFMTTPYTDNVSRLVNILNSVDINVDENSIGVLLNKYYYNSNPNVSLKRLIQGTPKVGSKDPVGLSQMFGEKGVFNKLLNDEISDVNQQALKLLSTEKAVRILAESYVAANPTAEDDSVIGPEGNLVYSYSEYNTITSMFEEWVKDDEFFNKLKSVTYNEGSYWLSQMEDPKIRKNISVDTMLSLIDRDSYDTGRGYLDIAPTEDILLKFNAILNNKMVLPTLANKRTYYVINGLNKLNVNIQDNKIDNDTIDVFANYAICEYKTIKEAFKAKDRFLSRVGVSEEVWNNMSYDDQVKLLNEKNTNYTDLVENYHYTVSNKGMRLGGNGYKFRYFRSFTDEIGNDEFFSLDNKKLRDAINSILIQNVNNTIKMFINKRIIAGDSKYLDEVNIKEKDNETVNDKIITKNLLLPNKLIKSKDTEKNNLIQAIAEYAINTSISVYEFEKLVSGDVAYYKTKNYAAMLDDRVKRYSALTSTKSVLRQDWPEGFLDFDTNEYNVAVLSSNIIKSQVMYDEMYSKYVGTDENHGLLWKQYEQFREDGVNGFFGLTDKELKEKVEKAAEDRLGNYLHTDQTDAQVLISPRMFRKLSIENGEWDDVKEAAYELMESDKELTVEEELQAYSVIMQPLKYIHYGFDFFNGLQVPIYDKMSLATVFKRVAKGRDLEKVYNLMQEKDIDMFKFETAVKSGLRQKGVFYKDGKINPEIDNIPVFKQSFKYLGKQLVTDPHHVSRIALGTQMAKIGVAGVEDNAVYEGVDGKQYFGNTLVQDYVSAVSRLSDIGKDNIYRDFGIKETTDENGNTSLSIDRNKFVSMLREDAISSNLPSNLIDVLKTLESESGTENYYIELSGLPALSWIQSRIISMIKKETIDINTPGGAMIQMSNFAYLDSAKEIDLKNYRYKYNKELRFKDENNRLECIVSINLFKDLLPKDYLISQAKENGTSYFEEARKFILSNKDLAVLSYRIPTQGMNSTLPVTVVDILPANVGDTIVLPAQLTTLTGADFDVDKMYLARYNYDVIGGKLYKVEFIDDYDGIDSNGLPIQLTEEEFLRKVYNYRYRHFNTPFYEEAKVNIPKVLSYVLADTNRNGVITEDSIEKLNSIKSKYAAFLNTREWDRILKDSALKPSKKIVKLSQTFNLESEKPSFEEFFENNKGKSKWELNNGKQIENKLLDIFQTTLTSSNHYMDATVPLDFATDALKEAVEVVDGYSNINKNYEDLEPLFPFYQENVKIQNVGADAGIGPMALINVFRVIMQISKLNLDKSLDINQKVNGKNIKRNLLRYLPVNNLYDKFDINGVSIMDWTSALINAHVDAAKDSYITRLNVNSFTYDVVALLTSAGVGINQFYFLPQPILKQIADESIRRKSSKIGFTKKERMSKKWQEDIVKEYTKKAKLPKDFYDKLNEGEYSSLVFDAEWLKKQLKDHYEGNLTPDWYKNQIIIYEHFKDIQSYSKALSNLVLASQVDTGKMGKNQAELLLSLHNIERVSKDPHFTNVEDVFNNTFLGRKMYNSTGLLFDLLKNEVIEFSPGFIKLVNKFGRLSNTYFDRKTNNINKYMSELKFAMQAEFFNNYIKANNISLKNLFYGNNTIVDRINKIRTYAITGTKYQDLANNMLLKMLIPGINETGKPKKFETVLKLRDTDAKNAYTYAWRDLLEYHSKEVRDAAKDLILYSFYTSGGRGTGVYATLDLVPFEVLGNMSYEKDGVEYTYNDHLRDLLKASASNALDYNKYLDYAFRALQGVEDIVQEATKQRVQNVGEQPVYFTVSEDDYLTTDKTPVPFLTSNGILFKLIGQFVDGENKTPVYASTNSINFKESGFTINEGSSSTFIEENKHIDATDMSITFTDKFSKDLGDFVPIDNVFDIDSDVTVDEDGEVVQNVEESSIRQYVSNQEQSTVRKTYSGKITTLEPNQIFVFGSNTQGRHGKGAALTAKNKFGAKYGQAEGIQGQSYAIITKDLTKKTHPSRTPEQIKEQIHNLYEYARQNPDKEFLVAYSGTGANLNAYSNQEMANMFASEQIPGNIVFEEEFNKLVQEQYNVETTDNNILSSNERDELSKSGEQRKNEC